MLIAMLMIGFVGLSPDTVSAQIGCKYMASVSGWGQYSGEYTACDHWMKATMEFDVAEAGEQRFLAYGANTPYQREFWAYQFNNGHHAVVDWVYCPTLTEHELSIDLPGGVQPSTPGFFNPVLTARYYAEKIE